MGEQLAEAVGRLPGESAKAWAAFVAYRDLGPSRTLDAAGWQLHGAQTGRKRGATGRIRSWAKKWRWRERAAAWDAHTDVIRRQAATKRIIAEIENHAPFISLALAKLVERINNASAEELTLAQAITHLPILIKAQRAIYGVAGDVSKTQHEGSPPGEPVQVAVREVIVRTRQDIEDLRRMTPGGKLLLDGPPPEPVQLGL